MKKFYHSVKVIFEPKKQAEIYAFLYFNDYIYKWSCDLCLVKFYRK